PDDLEMGFYYLLASHDKVVGAGDNQVQVTDFWVSDLSLVTRYQYGELSLGGLVVDAVSGNPVEGASVQAWTAPRAKYVPAKTVKTDEKGLFEIPTVNQQNHLLQIKTQKGDELVSANDYYTYTYNGEPQPDERTVFFTDRALYRPGQSIHYKGLVILVD